MSEKCNETALRTRLLRRAKKRLWPVVLCAAMASISAAAPASISASVQVASDTWITSWGAAQLEPYGSEVLQPGALEGATLRQVVHLSAGGTKLRLRISNAFGREPLQISSVHVALRTAGPVQGKPALSADYPVTFANEQATAIPMGADYVSDPVSMVLPSQADLVVTFYIVHAPANLTFHAGAHATSFLVKGNHATAPLLDGAQTFTRWYFLSGVETSSNAPASGSLVAFGDSITDGHASTTDGNDRWPDVLARRLAAAPATMRVGVVNEGVGGNRMLADGLGPDALARFDRDVLSITGVKTLVILEGINDLGGLDRTVEHSQAAHDALVSELMAAFSQMVLRAHAHGIQVLGGTLTPFLGSDYYHPTAVSEADRVKLNEWIRHSGTFDGVVDFDATLRDPSRPDHFLPEYDSGDHLHPGPAGYKRMGEVVPLSLIR